MTDLGKIGDQNVEFFKVRLYFFCATKSAQPFKSYVRLKIDKDKKKMQICEKSHFFIIKACFCHRCLCFISFVV